MIMVLAYAFFPPYLQTFGSCHAVLGARWVCVWSSISIFLCWGYPQKTWACSTSSVFSFLKQALGLFWHLCKCWFSAATLVLASLQTDLKLSQHSTSTRFFKCLRLQTSPWIHTYKHIVYPVGWLANCLTLCNSDWCTQQFQLFIKSAFVLLPLFVIHILMTLQVLQ